MLAIQGPDGNRMRLRIDKPVATSAEVQSTRARVIYVAPDCTDGAVRRRARGFLDAGVELISFCFRRHRYNVDFVPDWPNIELGVTTERRLLARVLAVFRSLKTSYDHRRTWRSASLLYARNLDLAVLTLIGKALTRSRAAFVYEVLDVHPATTQSGIRGVLLRWLERRVLARSRLLVISSPAFLRHYFQPIQGYRGESFLLENKWPSTEMSALARRLDWGLADQEPIWTIGWFGNIRCPESLEILTALADAFPTRIRIYIRGCATLLGEGKLLEVVRERDNMIFDGEYNAPGDLREIYSHVHFNWCIDLCGGKNSLWLLPNRLYEGGFFGIPALAIGNQETGRVVRERNLGISLDIPVVEHLSRILSTITREEYGRLRRGIEGLPEANFVDYGDMARLMRTVTQQGSPRDAWQPQRQRQHGGVGQTN